MVGEIFTPRVWLRYINEIFFAWANGEENLEKYLLRLNDFHPNFKFRQEESCKNLNFQDIKVEKEEEELATFVFFKRTNCYQYLDSAPSL